MRFFYPSLLLYQAFGIWCVVLTHSLATFQVLADKRGQWLLNWTVKVLVPHCCEGTYLFNIRLPQLMENSLRTWPSPH